LTEWVIEVIKGEGVVRNRRRALAMLGVTMLAPSALRAQQVQQSAGPYVPTPSEIVEEMLKLAGVRADDFVVDLGSGDGRIVITAALRYGARGFGVDIDPKLVQLANDNATKAGVADRVRFEQRDLFQTALNEATVLTLYLLPRFVVQLVPKIVEEMPAGARVVSHDYPLTPWPSDRHLTFDVAEKVNISGTARTVLFLYIVPARIGGEWRLEVPETLTQAAVRLALRRTSFRISGSATVGGVATPLEKLTVHGTQVTFAIPNLGPSRQPVQFSGTATGDTMEGTAALPAGPVSWRALRVNPS
jgi:hypothetical protein